MLSVGTTWICRRPLNLCPKPASGLPHPTSCHQGPRRTRAIPKPAGTARRPCLALVRPHVPGHLQSHDLRMRTWSYFSRQRLGARAEWNSRNSWSSQLTLGSREFYKHVVMSVSYIDFSHNECILVFSFCCPKEVSKVRLSLGCQLPLSHPSIFRS